MLKNLVIFYLFILCWCVVWLIYVYFKGLLKKGH